jgi:cytoskeletal protein CcmA (bactofilin family)
MNKHQVESEDILKIDPVALGITNRLSAGCTSIGHHQYQGGILVQGSLGGHVQVNGDLVLWAGGLLEGTIEVAGDIYIFGQLGKEESQPNSTVIKAQGSVFAAGTCISFGTIYGRAIKLYDGAQLFGPFMTIPIQDDFFSKMEDDTKSEFSMG